MNFDNFTVLLLNASTPQALFSARSLGRRGIRIIAADVDPHSFVFHSKYCHKGYVVPEPFSKPQ